MTEKKPRHGERPADRVVDSIEVLLTAEEFERVRRAATAQGLDVEAWARLVVLETLMKRESEDSSESGFGKSDRSGDVDCDAS